MRGPRLPSRGLAAAPRRAAFAIGLALLVALPSAGQQATAPGLVPEHGVFVEAAELSTSERGNTAFMNTGRHCGGERITFDPLGDYFRFNESTGTSCEAVFYNLTVPGPARTVSISFVADRVVTNETDDPCVPGLPCATPPLSLVQELQLDFPDGSSRIDPYFPNDAGSIPPTLLQREFLLPEGASSLQLQWFFQDEGVFGAQAPFDPGRARLDSTVSDIQVQFDGIRLPDPLGTSGPLLDNETSRFQSQQHWINVTVPPDAVGPFRTSSVTLEVRRGPSLLRMSGPEGPVSDQEFQAARIGDRIQYTIPGSAVAQQGPGTYAYQFVTNVALPPPEPADEPTHIYPFFFILALLPMVAAVLALHQANLYVRQAEGSYKRTAWPVFIAVLLVVVYYLLLLGYSLFGVGPTRMSTLPLAREPLLIYVQFVLLLLMLAGSALAVSRTLIGSMRRDIDERRRKEDQLRRSNEELERFAYVASHDLQEPLRKVAGFTALLQKRYSGRLDKDADEIIQYAVDGATRMQMLIKDILAYSRVGSKELQRVPVDANATMQLVVSDLGEQIKEQKAEVAWDALPTVRVDASQLRQILQNLVENAIKYRHANRRPKVRVSAVDEGNLWHFSVADNGQGIPADKHEEIFGIFRRLHGQDLPGTGIGLAVAKKAVERHGGKIWVDSAPGKGATFHFTLPRSLLDKGAWTSQAQGSSAAAPV